MICHECQVTRSELQHAYCSCQNLVKNVKIGELNCAFWDNYTPPGYCIISDRKYRELRQINSELWMLNFTIQHWGMREEMTRWLRRLNSIKEYRWDTSPRATGEVSKVPVKLLGRVTIIRLRTEMRISWRRQVSIPGNRPLVKWLMIDDWQN